MANERSVEIPIYLKLDKASYDKVEKAIQEAQSKATITTSDIRAKRGMAPRVSKVPVQGINYRDLASKVAQDYLKALGQEFGAKTKLVMPQFTFGGQYLQDLQQLPEDLEDYRDFFRDLNQAIFQFARAAGLKRQEVDLQDIDGEELFDLLQGKMIQIKDKLIPSLEQVEELHALTLAEAGKLNVPTMVAQTGTRAVTKVKAMPKGSYRQFADNSQTKPVIEEFRKRFESGKLDEVVAEALKAQAKFILDKTVNSLKELPEDEQTVAEGAQTLSFWLDDAIGKFLDNMLARGFEPGSEQQLANILTDMLGESLTQTQNLIINNLRQGYFVEGRANLSGGAATPLAGQVYNNPALMTQGRIGKGALTELKKSLDGQTQAQQKYGEIAKQIDESVGKISASGEEVIAVFDTEFNNQLPYKITEAAIELRDAGGKFVDGLTWVHTAANEMAALQKEGAGMAGLPDAATAGDFAKRLGILQAGVAGTPTMVYGGSGSAGAEKNFQEFYDKMFVLTRTLAAYAENNIPVYGANIQGAEFSNLSKSIEWVNSKLREMGSDLPELLYPAELEIKDVQHTLKAAAEAGDEFATVLTKDGKNVGKVLAQLPEDMRKAFSVGEGGDFSTAGVPGHYALADVRATFAIVQALMQNLGTMADVRTTKKVKSYDRDSKASAAGGGGGGLEAHIASGDAADEGRKYALTVSQITAELKLMTEAEKKVASKTLDALAKTKEHRLAMELLIDTEQKLKKVRESGPSKELGTEQELTALRDYAYLTAVKLERQKFNEVKATARAGQVADKYQNSAAKLVDTQIELEKSQQKVIAADIKGQMLDQEAAAKRVASANRDLINTWVTGRYALYDVGNAFENVSRNMAMATRRIFEITNAYRSYETAFTSVERTLPSLATSASGIAAEMGSLKQQFIEMSQVLPIAFEELSAIATLGAQMGVSASGIATFTETVAKFASITAISTDTVAQKFGRIAELADVDYAQMNNLGSSIAFAGINAVATESEILSLSESIAAVSNMAGMLPADIVGISTALASVGVQSEQARGVFTRVFADIDRAVSEGGDSLNAFAALSGMSADTFAKSWGTEGQSYAVFRNLLGGLGAAEDMTKAFDSLNIVETREINTLTRLAKNLNVLDQAFNDSTTAFEQGTFLGQAFEKTVDNLDSKIQIFTNNVNALTEELSKSMAGALGGTITAANALLEALRDVASTEIFNVKIFGGAANMALLIAGVGTAATLAVSIMAKLVAQVYAFNVASINTANSAGNVSASIGSTIKYLAGWSAGLVEVRDELEGVNGNVRGGIKPMQFYAAEITKQQKALRERNIVMLDVAQIQKTENVSQEKALFIARQRVDAINAQKAAMASGTATTTMYATAEGKLSTEAAKTNLQLNGQTQAVIKTNGAMAGLGRTARIAQGAIRGVGIAFGALSAITLVATGITMVSNAIEGMKINLLEAGGGLASLRDAIAQDTKAYNALSEEQKKLGTGYSLIEVRTKTYTEEANKNAEAIREITGASSDFVDANKVVTEGIESTTFALGENTRAWIANAAMQDENLQNAIKKYPGAFKSIEKYGLNLTDIINEIIADPNADPVGKLRDRVSELDWEIRNLMGLGVVDLLPGVNTGANALTEELKIQRGELEAIIGLADSLADSLGGALDSNEIFNAVKAALGLSDALEEGEDAANGLENGINGVADALRTVLDYAGDLSGIFGRVIELEIGKQIATDAITSGWRDLAQSAEDANKAIEDYKNTQDELAADKTILEYQLSVAERYGDEKRAAELRAAIAKKDAEIADNQQELADAQDAVSMSLTGNTDAAIENRAALVGMVSEYQAYFETLAKLGYDQGQLEKEIGLSKDAFLEQAKALGFSGDELQAYADLFDQFGKVATDAPRDVDIEVNPLLDAAEQAIQEFLAKDRSMSVGVEPETKEADKEIDSWLNDERYLAKPNVTGMTADAAERWLENWLNRRREMVPPQIKMLTADAAERWMDSWLDKDRTLKNPTVDAVNTTGAKNSLLAFITNVSRWRIGLIANLDKNGTVKALADATREIGVSLPIINPMRTFFLGISSALSSLKFANGGLVTGPGGPKSDVIPAMLSNGEFVVNAAAVRNYGPDFFNALNQQRVGSISSPVPVAAAGNSGSQIVYLSPDDRALLRAAIDRPVNLYADNTKIAQSANAGNQRLSQRGLK